MWVIERVSEGLLPFAVVQKLLFLIFRQVGFVQPSGCGGGIATEPILGDIADGVGAFISISQGFGVGGGEVWVLPRCAIDVALNSTLAGCGIGD